MARKLSKKGLRRKADKLWSLVIRTKSNNKCCFCGNTPEKKGCLQAHHLFARSIYQLRYVIKNGLSICATCHRVYAHNRPLYFAIMIVFKRILSIKDIFVMFKESNAELVITEEWYLTHINNLTMELKKYDTVN